MIDPNNPLAAIWAATSPPTPLPIPGFDGDPNLVTPGVIGFFLTLLVAVATVLLVIDMTRRVRRVRYREQINSALDAEQLAEMDVEELGQSDAAETAAGDPASPARD